MPPRDICTGSDISNRVPPRAAQVPTKEDTAERGRAILVNRNRLEQAEVVRKAQLRSRSPAGPAETT